jgi:hypothetical protein
MQRAKELQEKQYPVIAEPNTHEIIIDDTNIRVKKDYIKKSD